MRYVWTVAGDDPDFAQGDRHGIDGYFYPMFDPATTVSQLLATQARGHARGLYAAWNWEQFAGQAPLYLAATVSRELARFKAAGVTGLRFQWDNELHEPDRILAELKAMRNVMRNVGLSWTCEGMQGGWMDQAFATAIVALKVRVVPQAYWGPDGTIQGQYAADQVLRDLTRRGFPESSVSLFYDAARLDRDWQGYAFTMGRLPA